MTTEIPQQPDGLRGRELGLTVVGGRSGSCAGAAPGPTGATDSALPPPRGPQDRLAHPSGRWSSEIFDVPLGDDRHVIYAPLRRAAFVTTAGGRDALTRLAADDTRFETIDAALETFLRELGMIDGGPERAPDDLLMGASRPGAVTLFLTTACNLRCDYCYASAGDTVQEWMPWSVARRSIDTAVANALAAGADRVSLALHGGGEPTLNWEVLTRAVTHLEESAQRSGLGTTTTLATNGVVSEARADWLVEHLTSASVSCDGLPEVQDAHRPRVGGSGSARPLARTLRRFDAAGFAYNLRVTVTADQVDRLAESIDFLSSTYRPRRIQIEPAYRLGRWADSASAECDEFVDAFREAERHARAAGVELFYSAARTGLLTHHFCGVTRDTFAVSPQGNVSACYEVFSETQPFAGTFFYGAADPTGDGFVLDEGKLGGLREHATGHHAFCEGCFAKWSCAGDCYHKALAESGDGRFRGSQRCHITRTLTADQIVRQIGEAGGVAWFGGPDRPSPEAAVTIEEPA